MLREFDDILDEMMFRRLEDIGTNILMTNKEYREASTKLIEINYKIRDLLPEEHRHLIDDYEEITSAQGALSDDIIYKQALKDGIELKHLLRLVV